MIQENEQKNFNKTSALEAVLFIFGEPVDLKKLSSILEIKEEEVKEIALKLSQELSSEDRGIMLVNQKDKYMLSTKPQHSLLIEKFITENLKEDLTPAALETLSLIAYFGPVTRAQIDYIRGVNSSFILRNLLVRGLVERKSGKGLAFDYEVSFEFLKFMGIDNVSKMPDYEKYQGLKNQYLNAQQSNEAQAPIFEPSSPASEPPLTTNP